MTSSQERKHVVSVSIGSSKRDHSVETDVMGVPFLIERVGTDGDMEKAKQMIRDYDGKVDAIGLGGIDLYLIIGKKRYTLKDGKKLADCAKISPTYDGSMLKHTIERGFIMQLAKEGKYLRKGSKVLVISSADRFGMAEALFNSGCDVVLGDLMFTLNLPIPLRTLPALKIVASILVPIVSNVPFELLYPTGKKQEKRTPKFEDYFQRAEVIAGDFNYINRYMPDDMAGKTIITNTVTASDVEEMKKMGVATLITTTPDFGGRSFGTNVMEGVYSTILGRNRKNPLTIQDLDEMLKKSDLKPRILPLNE